MRFIYLLEDEEGKRYYGSCKNVKKRVASHRNGNGCRSQLLKKTFNCTVLHEFNDTDIDLIALKYLERHYIDNNECVNRFRPIISRKDRDIYRAKYYQENGDRERKINKAYYLRNRDSILSAKREVYSKNKDVINLRRRCQAKAKRIMRDNLHPFLRSIAV